MHYRLLFPVLCLPCAHAGEPSVVTAAKSEPWLTPTLQIRARYEHASMDAPGVDAADAFTVRERVGLKFKSAIGLSALVEGEFTQAPVDDYDASAGGGTSPDNPNRTQINDPRNAELNQAWVAFSKADTELKVGRQRIILDNAALIGNSGWRQNEQTFDGITIENKSIGDLTLFYSYLNRVNRIFGHDAIGVQNHFSGDIHLLNARYEATDTLSLTGYIYLMDFDNTGGAFSNNTYGFSAERSFELGDTWKGKFHGELAWQDDGGNSAIQYDAWYGHFIISAGTADHTFSIGYEHLGADGGTSFRTPLATAHAFNGFSDALATARLEGTPGGIGDLYLTYDVKLPWQLTGQVALHWMGQDDMGFDYGKELNLVLSRKFDKNLQAILKLAFYDSKGPLSGAATNPAPFDVSRCSVEMNYSF